MYCSIFCRRTVQSGISSYVLGMLLLCAVLIVNGGEECALVASTSSALAAEGAADQSPYGGSKSGTYGTAKGVATVEEAQKVLKEYFSKKDVKIGEIKEKELFFEADILDKKGSVIDKVIVDKRTGRIRSIF